MNVGRPWAVFCLFLPAVLVKSKPELLDGGDNDLVRIVVGLEAADKRLGVGVFLNAIFLKPVELLSGLAVQILAVNDEKAFVDALVVFEQCGGLEGGQGLARTSRMPDIAVTAVLVDAVDYGPDSIDLIRAHHQELLLGRYENHVPADHMAKCAFGEEPFGEVVQVSDLGVVFGRELVDWKEMLVRIESEVSYVVVGEVPSISAVADNKELDKTEKRSGVSVT